MAIEVPPTALDIIDTRKRRGELRVLLRLFGWGGAATLALAVVAIISQTEAGGQRLQGIVSHIAEPRSASASNPWVEHVIERAVENEAATRRLAAEVRTLTTDRDRLAIRLASLEQHLDDMTGSIKQQAEQATKPSPPSSAKVLEPTPIKTEAIKPPKPTLHTSSAAVTPPSPILPVLAMPALNAPSGTWPGEQALASAPPASPSQEVPLPQARVASARGEPQPPVPPAPIVTDFGVDLGGAASPDLLRLRWATMKANFGPLLAGLRPVAALEHRPGPPSYRLVVGPLPNYAEAAKLCARITAARAICRPAKFDGQVLAQR